MHQNASGAEDFILADAPETDTRGPTAGGDSSSEASRIMRNMNRAALQGRGLGAIDEVAFEAAVKRLASAPLPVEKPVRQEHLRLLQMMELSYERLAKADKMAPGSFPRRFGFAVDRITELRDDGLFFPGLDARLYWFADGPGFFDGLGELAFRDAVRCIEALHGLANKHLMPICEGLVGVSDPRAPRLLEWAGTYLGEVGAVYRSFSRSSTRPISEPEFTYEMRAFLGEIMRDGKSVKTVNAAWLPEVCTTDLLLGTASMEHRKHLVDEVRPHLRVTDQVAFDRAYNTADIFHLLLAALGWPEDVEALTQEGMTPPVARTCLAWDRCVQTVAGSTAAHTNAIKHYLIDYPKGNPSKYPLPVGPSEGTGGASHDAMFALVPMRRMSDVRHALRLHAQRAIAGAEGVGDDG